MRLPYLFERYLKRTCTEQEEIELMQLLADPGLEDERTELAGKYYDAIPSDYDLNEETANRIFYSIINKPATASPNESIVISIDEPAVVNKPSITPVHRVHFLKTTWFKYAAAIILLFGIGAYLWNDLQKDKPLITQSKPVPAKKDILPGFNRATLTLSDGKKIALDSAASETIKDGALSIENNKGRLVYKKGVMEGVNTMTTPKGGQYQLTLSDGTKVWLNAASSITYPTAFTNKTREVSISGEAYFEVATNKSQPFIVSVMNTSSAGGAGLSSPFEKGGRSGLNENTDRRGIYQITVLGTEFNVNTYPDEISKTSLISGSVRISENPPADSRSPQVSATPFSKGGGYTLKPGEAYTNNKIIKTNLTQDIAWKNGLFNFDKLHLKQVLNQISRWYDIDIKYASNVPDIIFVGEMQRSLNLSQVLKILSKMEVKFRLEGRTLTVLP
ncbi:MAG: FecR family protein [Chitinophagaceae bacterium]|nr:FecR family protein [Chitinophagaceae bacterium]